MKKLTHEEFVQRMSAVRPNIEILGTYTKSSDYIEYRCKTCNNIWTNKASNLMAGIVNCVVCSGKKKKSHEEFIEEFKNNNPHYDNIEVNEKYKSINSKIECRCKICGTTWFPTAKSLTKKKTGCPNCRFDTIAMKRRKSQSQFVSEMKTINPNITILGEYVNNKSYIKCQCDECGYIWESLAQNLLMSRSCPNYRNHTGFISPKAKDFTGNKFGMLTALERIKTDKGIVYKCQCDCGNIIEVKSSNLISGNTHSCGCYRKISSRIIDLQGKKFGRLTAIERTAEYGNVSGVKWVCQCDCGNTTIVSGAKLRSGETKSCGCLQRETAQKNFVDLSGNKYGKLFVIERADDKIDPDGTHRTMFKCKCDCGNICYVNSYLLTHSERISCGCVSSRGEYNIIQYLNKNNIKYTYQRRFDDLLGLNGGHLSYDFEITDRNILIEAQGQQHVFPVDVFGGAEQFERQQLHDKLKREYAKANGYRLIEISYKDYDRIDEVLSKELNIKELEVV